MLRKIRIVLAAVFYVLITLLLLDFTGFAHKWLGWMAKMQFLPAVLALNVVVIVALMLLTLVFGREATKSGPASPQEGKSPSNTHGQKRA